MKPTIKIGRKALPHRGGNGKLPGGIPSLRHHHGNGLDTDRTGKPAKISDYSFFCGMSHTKNLVQNYSDHFGNSQRSSLSPTGGVKSTSPGTENHKKNGYVKYAICMTTNEDINHDTNYTDRYSGHIVDSRGMKSGRKERWLKLLCSNCLVSTLSPFVLSYFFPSVPCLLAVAMVFHVGNNWTQFFC